MILTKEKCKEIVGRIILKINEKQELNEEEKKVLLKILEYIIKED